MGHERKYIRNLALSLMGQLNVDQEVFYRWSNFPPVITPAKAMSVHCGLRIEGCVRNMSAMTMGRIASFGRQDCRPYVQPSGTTLSDVLGKNLDSRDWGGKLLHQLACATIIAEMTDILLERLTPEQRARFQDDGDDGTEPSRGRSVRLDELGAE